MTHLAEWSLPAPKGPGLNPVIENDDKREKATSAKFKHLRLLAKLKVFSLHRWRQISLKTFVCSSLHPKAIRPDLSDQILAIIFNFENLTIRNNFVTNCTMYKQQCQATMPTFQNLLISMAGA